MFPENLDIDFKFVVVLIMAFIKGIPNSTSVVLKKFEFDVISMFYKIRVCCDANRMARFAQCVRQGAQMALKSRISAHLRRCEKM